MNMNMQTKFEKEVRRSLDILIKNFRAQTSTGKSPKEVELEIYLDDVDYKDPENVSPSVFCNTVRSFKNEGIKINEYDRDGVLSDSMQYGAEHASFCSVTVPANFEEIYERLTRSKDATGSAQRRLIEKDPRGDYFYDGKFITFAKDTLPFKVFDALYSHSDQEGFLSYKDIEAYLVKSGEPESETDEKRNKRIINAVSGSQGLFRFTKINKKPLENKIPNGAALLDVRKGKGLRLNNPTI